MKNVEKIERFIVTALLIMMQAVVVLATVQLGWLLISDIFIPLDLMLDVDELLDVFGMFLLVLIGIELLETVKMYLSKKMVRVEVVLSVAIIAIAKKVITLDIKEVPGVSLIGIGVIIISLATAYYLIKMRELKDRK